MESATGSAASEGAGGEQQSGRAAQRVSAPERAPGPGAGGRPSHLTGKRGKKGPQKEVPESTEKTEETIPEKKRRQKTRRRKKNKSVSQNEINSLLAELPFAHTEIREEFGFTTTLGKNLKKKRKRTLGGESEEDAGQKKKKETHPNYFVSIPITNPKIVGGIQAVQDIVVQKDQRLSRAMIPVPTLHITILVTNLASEMEVNRAVSAFEECKATVQEILQGTQLALQFQGIAHFRGEVVFAQLLENEHLMTLTRIADTLKSRFQAEGILTGDNKPFKPHLTFIKLSKAPKLRHQGIKKVDSKLYKSFEDHWFGDEIVCRLDLCSMLKKKQPNGYYHCETSFAVGKKHESAVIRNAVQKETMTVLSKLNQIKELLSHPETQMKIRNEMAVKCTQLKHYKQQDLTLSIGSYDLTKQTEYIDTTSEDMGTQTIEN
ncbi:A-kinase anchor protein 7 isoform X3 [Callorhinchus milii]|uniref:A-kinase anchor protein 7 isoform X3 n=1 Tax=Callorhinchus milii TaxID=7868 RepID=UPI001C3F840B|nr:A-kinase anchor protein 7 isoform X3 [Callorhinchus milii]